MPWVRYDDQFPKHRKVLEVKAVDRTALTLHLLCETWSASTSTPGLVSDAAAIEEAGGKARAKRWAKVLVEADLWHAPGHDCPRCPQIDKGYVIHDYPIYNPHEELAAKRSDAGKKGAAARWGKQGKRHGNPMANAMPEPSDSHADASSNGVTENAPSPSPSPSPDRGSVGKSSSRRNARGPDDDLEQTIDKRIIEVLYEQTGRYVEPDHAAAVRHQLLDDRPNVNNPLAYVAAAIRGEPRRYMPAPAPPDREEPWMRPRQTAETEAAAARGRAAAEQARLAAKARAATGREEADEP